MITRIGVVAGDIWNYLEKHDSVACMDDIINVLGIEQDLVLMSIGWLSREGHVILEGKSPNYVVRLKK